ncbi:MAG: hypothetical protein MEFUS_01907 [Fusobacterium varium]
MSFLAQVILEINILKFMGFYIKSFKNREVGFL